MRKFFTIAILAFTINASAQNPWTLQNSQISDSLKDVFSIVVTNPTTAWAAIYDNHTNPVQCEFRKTIDGGANWVPGTIGQSTDYKFASIASLNKDTAWAALFKSNGITGDIFRTYDGGSTWTTPDPTIYKGATSFPNAIYFFDKNYGCSLGDPESGYFENYITSNGGTSWTRVPSGNIPPPLSGEEGRADKFCVVNNTIWYPTNKGRVLKSTDMGFTWSVSAPFASTIPVGCIAFKDSLNGIAFGTGTGYRKRTTDGGLTWNSYTISGSGYMFSMYGKSFVYAKGNGSIPGMYICGGSAQASYSIDNGVTWNLLDNMFYNCFGFWDVTTGWTSASANSPVHPDIYKFNGIPTNIDNISYQNDISIYPNPSKGVFLIKSETIISTIEIANVLGEKIYSIEANSDKIEIDLSNQPKGVYFYLIQNDRKVLNTGKMIME